MSYSIAKSISVTKNGIFITCADNNTYPKRYQRIKYNGTLGDLYDDFVNGNIDFVKAANDYKWYYINYIVFSKVDKLFQKIIFCDLAMKRYGGNYIVKIPQNRYVSETTRNMVIPSYSTKNALIMNLFKATYFANILKGEVIKL